MAVDSKIDWCDHTWNPFYGCPDDGKRSPACDNCYARQWAKRSGLVDFDKEIRIASAKTLAAPLNKKKYKSGDRVFVGSLADYFNDDNAGSYTAMRFTEIQIEIHSVIQQRHDLIWIFLTKRPENINHEWRLLKQPNVWLGVTAENTEQASKRIPELLNIPAAVHFVSCEPLLEGIDIRQHLGMYDLGCLNGETGSCEMSGGLDWVICGAESGAKKRPMREEWATQLQADCEVMSTPFFFKQQFINDKKTDLLDGKQYKELPHCYEG